MAQTPSSMTPPSAPTASAALVPATPMATPAAKALTITMPAPPASHLTFDGNYLLANPILLASVFAGTVALGVGLLTFFGVLLSLRMAHERMRAELAASAREGMRNREHTRHEAMVERESSRAQAAADREHSRIEADKEREHSADEAQRDRLMEARKVVYLKLVDDCMKAIAMLGALPSIDMTAKPAFVADTLTELGASVNKMWLVSDVGTAVKARELHAQIVQLFMRIMKRMPPLQALKTAIAQAKRRRDAAAAESDRLLAALHDNKNFNGSNQQVMAGLMQSRQFQLDNIAKADAEIAAANDQHAPMMRAEGQYVVNHVGELMNGIQDLMLSARIELGLEGDNEVLRQQTLDMYERAKHALDDFNASGHDDPKPDK